MPATTSNHIGKKSAKLLSSSSLRNRNRLTHHAEIAQRNEERVDSHEQRHPHPQQTRRQHRLLRHLDLHKHKRSHPHRRAGKASPNAPVPPGYIEIELVGKAEQGAPDREEESEGAEVVDSREDGEWGASFAWGVVGEEGLGEEEGDEEEGELNCAESLGGARKEGETYW